MYSNHKIHSWPLPGQSDNVPLWLISQDIADVFATLKEVIPWNYMDVVCAAMRSTYGGNAAHAPLTLSLFPKLYIQRSEPRGRVVNLDCGFDKV